MIWKWLRGPPHDTHKKQKSKIVKEKWDIPTDILPINFPQPTWLAIQVDLIVAVNVISLFSCLFCIYQKKACHFAVWGTRTLRDKRDERGTAQHGREQAPWFLPAHNQAPTKITMPVSP